jgi:hypothetical protein
MKMVKSLLLGSAAGLVAVAGAQAADLPVKAKPVQYVKICSLYGVGFYYVPGTDLCLKVGGWARFETGWGYNGSFTTEWWNNNLDNRSTNMNNWRVKGIASFDARSPTQYGTVRSYITIGTSNNNNADNPTTANYANRWFIQWAGFTIGHSSSFFDFYSIGANQYGFVNAGSDSGDGGWDVFAYTANFGNGFSGTLSAEVQRRTRIINTGPAAAGGIAWSTVGITTAAGQAFPSGAVGGSLITFGAANPSGYMGHDWPDLVGNLRVDQPWGSAQVMAALHVVGAQYYGASAATALETAGHPDEELGFAVGAGVKINADMIGKGDYFQIEGDYTQGASRYDNMTALVWDYIKYRGNTVGLALNTDAVYGGSPATANATSLQLTTTWGVNAAFTHNWDPSWKTTLWGGYMAMSYNTLSNAMLCSALGPGGGAGAGTTATAVPGCDMDWQIWGGGLRTQWAVSSTFQIGLEVLYANLDGLKSPTGTAFLAPNGTKPGGLYTLDNQDNWAIRLRVNRDFYP